ncbi:hypothetical protein GXW82_02080 [Streptacidiphilus sp. 4-A2]|nr:hypothetical protein [Streptacidiphilus sp. 4-A2]
MLKPAGLEALKGDGVACLSHFSDVIQSNVADVHKLDTLFKPLREVPQAWHRRLHENTPGYVTTVAPVLVMQGTADTVINPHPPPPSTSSGPAPSRSRSSTPPTREPPTTRSPSTPRTSMWRGSRHGSPAARPLELLIRRHLRQATRQSPAGPGEYPQAPPDPVPGGCGTHPAPTRRP